MPVIILKKYNIAPLDAIAQSPKVKSEASATCSGLVRDAWAGARPGHPVGHEPTVRFCEVFNKPHTQESVDLSALCEVCEVCEVLDKKINYEPK